MYILYRTGVSNLLLWGVKSEICFAIVGQNSLDACIENVIEDEQELSSDPLIILLYFNIVVKNCTQKKKTNVIFY